MDNKKRNIAIGGIIVAVILVFAFWRPFTGGGGDSNDAAQNTSIPAPNVIDAPGNLDNSPLPPVGGQDGRPTDSRSPNESRMGSKTQDNEAKWSASSKGFSTAFGEPTNDINVLLERVKPFTTPELVDRMKTIDPRNMDPGTWIGDTVLQYGDTDIYVQSTYSEGWSVKLHLSKQGDGNWLVDTYTKG